MKELIEKLLQRKKRNTVILIVLLVIVLITLLFLNGVIKWPFNNNTEDKQNSAEDVYLKNLADEAKKALEAENQPEIMTVKVATLANDDGSGIISGKKMGCDIVLLNDRLVYKSPDVLNYALAELFRDDQDFDYLPGNFVAKQENLDFHYATLENGVAKVYLKGEVVYGGVCDDPRLEIQVTETAKRFGTVKDVEIYLNGVPYEVPSQE